MKKILFLIFCVGLVGCTEKEKPSSTAFRVDWSCQYYNYNGATCTKRVICFTKEQQDKLKVLRDKNEKLTSELKTVAKEQNSFLASIAGKNPYEITEDNSGMIVYEVKPVRQ